jgi:hypothetical protein
MFTEGGQLALDFWSVAPRDFLTAGVGSAIAGVGSLAGGLFGGASAKSAAGQQAAADEQAAQLQQQRYLQTRSDLSPYNTAGQQVLPALNALAMSGPTGGGPDYVDLAYKNYLPPQMTQAQLEQTPGYQFQMSQGLKALQSANAAKGLGVSGAALKGAAQFATGLANSNYQQQFANAQQRFADVSGLSTLQQNQLQGQAARLQNVAALGESAAAQTGTTGASLAQSQGNALIAGGQANAAGTIGASNALTGGINNALGYYQLQNLLKPTSGDTSGGYINPSAAYANSPQTSLSPTFNSP